MARFAELLRDAVAGPVQMIAVMRSEFLDDLRTLPALAGRPIKAYLLSPLDREMLRDVIEAPAKMARLRWSPTPAAARRCHYWRSPCTSWRMICLREAR